MCNKRLVDPSIDDSSLRKRIVELASRRVMNELGTPGGGVRVGRGKAEEFQKLEWAMPMRLIIKNESIQHNSA